MYKSDATHERETCTPVNGENVRNAWKIILHTVKAEKTVSREGHRLMGSGNKVLRILLGHKRQEVTGPSQLLLFSMIDHEVLMKL
jgi:hypothetical protein